MENGRATAYAHLETSDFGSVGDVCPTTQLHGDARHVDDAHDVPILLAKHGDRAAGACLLDAHAGGLERNRVSDPLWKTAAQSQLRHLR